MTDEGGDKPHPYKKRGLLRRHAMTDEGRDKPCPNAPRQTKGLADFPPALFQQAWIAWNRLPS